MSTKYDCFLYSPLFLWVTLQFIYVLAGAGTFCTFIDISTYQTGFPWAKEVLARREEQAAPFEAFAGSPGLHPLVASAWAVPSFVDWAVPSFVDWAVPSSAAAFGGLGPSFAAFAD